MIDLINGDQNGSKASPFNRRKAAIGTQAAIVQHTIATPLDFTASILLDKPLNQFRSVDEKQQRYRATMEWRKCTGA